MAMATLLLVASCSPRKKLVKPTPETDFEWMTAKMTMDVASPGMEMNNVSGMLRMRRDSALWISASAMLGMESVRTLITQDSVFLINRFDQTYLIEPYPVAAEKMHLPATFQEIQALLLGDRSIDHVELQFGPYRAKIKYSDVHWDEPTTFPIKINKNYERVKL